MNKVSQSVRRKLGIWYRASRPFHSQTDGQASHFKKNIVSPLTYYVAEYQRSWEMFVQPFTYAQNMQVNRSTDSSPNSLVLSRHKFGLSLLTARMNTPEGSSDATSLQSMRGKIQLRSADLRPKIDAHARKSEQYKRDYDRHVQETPVFKPNVYVFVDISPLRSTNDKDASSMSKQPCNKIQLQSSELFGIFTIQEGTLPTDEHRILQIASINRVTNALKTTRTNHQSSPQNQNSPSRSIGQLSEESH